MRLTPFLFIVVALGCTHYEYDLTEPPDLAAHIGTTDRPLSIDPLRYHLQTSDNRLVIRIQNPLNDAVELLGDRSVVVSPDGQSHPLRSQTIAPGTYIKLIFPPLRPRFQTTPTFGIGVGAVHRVSAFHDAFLDPDTHWPRYLYVAEDDTIYWDWDANERAQMTLVFRHNNDTFQHHFTFLKRNM